MKLIISKLAFNEILEAIQYYDLQQENLGKSFKSEIEKSLLTIKKYPYLYPNIAKDIKRCLLHKFPYSIFYSLIENKTILILSIAHQHRKPKY